jgi:hypothetical protein
MSVNPVPRRGGIGNARIGVAVPVVVAVLVVGLVGHGVS